MSRRNPRPGKKKKPSRLPAKSGGKSDGSARNWLALAVVLISLGALGFGLFSGVRMLGRLLFSENPQFTIRRIEVETDGQLDQVRIQQYADVRAGENLFAVSPDEICGKLEKVPQVESTVVRRVLPDTLCIDVRERVAVARIQGRKKIKYPPAVDRFGVVVPPRLSYRHLPLIEGVADFSKDRPLVPGMEVEDGRLGNALTVLELCQTRHWGNYVPVRSMDVHYQDFVEVTLKDGTLALLPVARKEVLEQRLRKLAAILVTTADRGQPLAKIDLTVDGINVPTVPRK